LRREDVATTKPGQGLAGAVAREPGQPPVRGGRRPSCGPPV